MDFRGSRQVSVVLIDEIENGLHHAHYARLWETLRSFAKESNIQLFAVTHSGEFLREALAATPDNATVAAWRLERDDAGDVAAMRFGAEDALAALGFGVELR